MSRISFLFVLILILSSCAKETPPHPITEMFISIAASKWNLDRETAHLVDSVFSTGVEEDREAMYRALHEAEIISYRARTLGGSSGTYSTSRSYYKIFETLIDHDSTDMERLIREHEKEHLHYLCGELVYPDIKNPYARKWLLDKIDSPDSKAAASALKYLGRYGSKEEKLNLLTQINAVQSSKNKATVIDIFDEEVDSIDQLLPLFDTYEKQSDDVKRSILRAYSKRVTKEKELEILFKLFPTAPIFGKSSILGYAMLKFNTEKTNALVRSFLKDTKPFPSDYYFCYKSIVTHKRLDLIPLINEVKDDGRFYNRREYTKLMDTLNVIAGEI